MLDWAQSLHQVWQAFHKSSTRGDPDRGSGFTPGFGFDPRFRDGFTSGFGFDPRFSGGFFDPRFNGGFFDPRFIP